MTPPWGINWQSYHKDQQDMPHVERMGYRSFTIYEWMWSDRGFCNELLSVARQDAIFLDRDHPLSEQKDDEWKRDPAGKGRKHADEWAQKVREGRVYTPLDRTYFLGLNEPDSEHFQRQIDAYNEAYCRRMAEHGLRAAAYSFGVGHPSTVDLQPKNPVDWSWYEASAAAILEGNHIAAFHEYGAPGNYGWGYWCNRISHCPYPFDAILDECGIDHGVLKSGYLYGWAIALKPEEYVAWLDGFQLGMAQRVHTRKVKIKAYNIFSFDHGRGETKDWHSFDIRPLRALLEAYQWSVAPEQPSQPDSEQDTIYMPNVGTGSKPVEPTEQKPMSIIDPLVGQTLIKVESGGQAFGPDDRPLIRFENHIFKTKLGNDALYARHFQHGSPVWTGHRFRRSEGDPWYEVHTGNQASEYAAFQLALSLNRQAAYESISMGLGQIMGFNARRVGFSSAEAMFAAFHNEAIQVLGFINFFLSDPQLAHAVQSKDWRTIARLYNGPGNVDNVAPLLERTYRQLAGA